LDSEDASRVFGCSAAVFGVGLSLVPGAAADEEVEALALGAGVAGRRLVAAAVVVAVGDAAVDVFVGAVDVPGAETPLPGLAALVALGFAVGFGLGFGVGVGFERAEGACPG
jgi:hypothetical protein